MGWCSGSSAADWQGKLNSAKYMLCGVLASIRIKLCTKNGNKVKRYKERLIATYKNGLFVDFIVCARNQ